jgi:putative hydrolase of the HAD superfamily
MNIEPGDALFLDDLGINLKPARTLGMSTIKVLNTEQALDDLEDYLEMSVR